MATRRVLASASHPGEFRRRVGSKINRMGFPLAFPNSVFSARRLVERLFNPDLSGFKGSQHTSYFVSAMKAAQFVFLEGKDLTPDPAAEPFVQAFNEWLEGRGAYGGKTYMFHSLRGECRGQRLQTIVRRPDDRKDVFLFDVVRQAGNEPVSPEYFQPLEVTFGVPRDISSIRFQIFELDGSVSKYSTIKNMLREKGSDHQVFWQFALDKIVSPLNTLFPDLPEVDIIASSLVSGNGIYRGVHNGTELLGVVVKIGTQESFETNVEQVDGQRSYYDPELKRLTVTEKSSPRRQNSMNVLLKPLDQGVARKDETDSRPSWTLDQAREAHFTYETLRKAYKKNPFWVQKFI